MNPKPTLQERLIALRERILAGAYKSTAPMTALAIAKEIQSELDAFNRDLGEQLTGIRVEDVTAKTLDEAGGVTPPSPIPIPRWPWYAPEAAPLDQVMCVLAFYKGVNSPVSGLMDRGRFYPHTQHGSMPITHWMPMPHSEH